MSSLHFPNNLNILDIDLYLDKHGLRHDAKDIMQKYLNAKVKDRKNISIEEKSEDLDYLRDNLTDLLLKKYSLTNKQTLNRLQKAIKIIEQEIDKQ